MQHYGHFFKKRNAIEYRFENNGLKGNVTQMRRFFAFLLRPIYFALILSLLKLQGMKRKKFGNCSFWGSEDFLKLCDLALVELRDLDPVLFDEITENRKLYFYSTNKRNEQVASEGVFGLNNQFCSWGTKGVIARVVYAFYASELMHNRTFSPSEIPLRDSLYSRANGQTRSWLKTHNFPSNLEEFFK